MDNYNLKVIYVKLTYIIIKQQIIKDVQILILINKNSVSNSLFIWDRNINIFVGKEKRKKFSKLQIIVFNKNKIFSDLLGLTYTTNKVHLKLKQCYADLKNKKKFEFY